MPKLVVILSFHGTMPLKIGGRKVVCTSMKMSRHQVNTFVVRMLDACIVCDIRSQNGYISVSTTWRKKVSFSATNERIAILSKHKVD